MAHAVHGKEGEVQDLPFVRNDMKDHNPTMDKSLDATDAPGRADSEMVTDAEMNPRVGESTRRA